MSRGLLAAVALLAVLGGAVYWSNKDAEKQKDNRPADAPPLVVKIAEADIQELRFRKGGEETRVKFDGKWKITAPRELMADQSIVLTVAQALNELASDRLVEENAADLGAFGLANPSFELEVVKKGGKSVKLQFGDETPNGNALFARVDGENKVYAVATFTKNNLDKSWKDLRDKRLLTIESDAMSRMELTAKGQTLEFGKINEKEWQILKPRPLRADAFQVADLARKITGAQMDAAVSDEDAKKAEGSFAGGAKVALVKLTGAAGTQELEIRKVKDDYFAKSSAVEGVHKIAKDLAEAADKDLDFFRNKKLFSFGFDEPAKIEFRLQDATTVRTKSGDGWMTGGKKMDSTSVAAFVDKLRDLAAKKFVEKPLPAPTLEITVTAGKATEKVLAAKSGEVWLARRDPGAEVAEVDAKTMDELILAHHDIKEPAPAKAPEKKK